MMIAALRKSDCRGARGEGGRETIYEANTTVQARPILDLSWTSVFGRNMLQLMGSCWFYFEAKANTVS